MGLNLLCALQKLYPNDFKFRDSSIDRLSGDKKIREMIQAGRTPIEIISYWQNELNDFKELRKKYLLY